MLSDRREARETVKRALTLLVNEEGQGDPMFRAGLERARMVALGALGDPEHLDLREALKRLPVTPTLRRCAAAYPDIADQAVLDCEDGRETCAPGSWVSEIFKAERDK